MNEAILIKIAIGAFLGGLSASGLIDKYVTPRKRDSLPKEVQEERIRKAEEKRARKKAKKDKLKRG